MSSAAAPAAADVAARVACVGDADRVTVRSHGDDGRAQAFARLVLLAFLNDARVGRRTACRMPAAAGRLRSRTACAIVRVRARSRPLRPDARPSRPRRGRARGRSPPGYVSSLWSRSRPTSVSPAATSFIRSSMPSRERSDDRGAGVPHGTRGRAAAKWLCSVGGEVTSAAPSSRDRTGTIRRGASGCTVTCATRWIAWIRSPTPARLGSVPRFRPARRERSPNRIPRRWSTRADREGPRRPASADGPASRRSGRSSPAGVPSIRIARPAAESPTRPEKISAAMSTTGQGPRAAARSATRAAPARSRPRTEGVGQHVEQRRARVQVVAGAAPRIHALTRFTTSPSSATSHRLRRGSQPDVDPRSRRLNTKRR